MTTLKACSQCQIPLATINGRTLKEAQKVTTAAKDRRKVKDTEAVQVCPICEAVRLGLGHEYTWPVSDHLGIMRTAADYAEDDNQVPVLNFLGFRFTPRAFDAAYNLMVREWTKPDPEKSYRTDLVEAAGEALTPHSTPEEFYRFTKLVCRWGRGSRVWANLNRLDKDKNVAAKLKDWMVLVLTTGVTEASLRKGMKIKGLKISFLSKHLRMLDPKRYAVLDSVLSEGLGLAMNPRGYLLFLDELRKASPNLKPDGTLAEVEGALFLLVRQQVRSISGTDPED